MKQAEFEQFVEAEGKDILRFCRILTASREIGDELYQDAMLKLLEKCRHLETDHNPKSYALSTALLLWKNRQKKYAHHMRLAPTTSFDALTEQGLDIEDGNASYQPEKMALQKEEVVVVRQAVSELPDKYRLPVYLFYTANMSVAEIAECMDWPEGTVKTRLYMAKKLMKKKLEAMGYDG